MRGPGPMGPAGRLGLARLPMAWVGRGCSSARPTALDYDSLSTGAIDQTAFNVNLGLGTASMFNPLGPILISPYIFINNTYPGGLGQWMMDNPEAMMPIGAGYTGK
jgi:hypothetical protein